MVVLLIAFFGEETQAHFSYFAHGYIDPSYRMYDRTVKPIPQRPTQGLRYRVETLIGMTGIKMAKYRPSWYQATSAILRIVWRPHVLSILIFEVCSV
jgi:hypothetical protein